MANYRTLLIACALLLPVAVALKCYVITPPRQINVSYPEIGAETECAIGTLSCTKTNDFNVNTVSKACGPVGTNCTGPNFATNQQASCYNTTGVNQQSCCCYGDRCNSGSFTSAFVGLLLAIFALFNYHN